MGIVFDVFLKIPKYSRTFFPVYYLINELIYPFFPVQNQELKQKQAGHIWFFYFWNSPLSSFFFRILPSFFVVAPAIYFCCRCWFSSDSAFIFCVCNDFHANHNNWRVCAALTVSSIQLGSGSEIGDWDGYLSLWVGVGGPITNDGHNCMGILPPRRHNGFLCRKHSLAKQSMRDSLPPNPSPSPSPRPTARWLFSGFDLF